MQQTARYYTWNTQVASHCHSDLTSTLNSTLLQDPPGPCDKLHNVQHVRHLQHLQHMQHMQYMQHT